MKGPNRTVVVGDIVLFKGFQSNGVDVQPAIVTRVWSETMVNLTVLPDVGMPICFGSVHYDGINEQPSWMTWREKQVF